MLISFLRHTIACLGVSHKVDRICVLTVRTFQFSWFLKLPFHHVRLYFPRKLQVTLPLPVNKIFAFPFAICRLPFAKLPTEVLRPKLQTVSTSSAFSTGSITTCSSRYSLILSVFPFTAALGVVYCVTFKNACGSPLSTVQCPL